MGILLAILLVALLIYVFKGIIIVKVIQLLINNNKKSLLKEWEDTKKLLELVQTLSFQF